MVIVVGGMGSLAGAFVASLLIGLLQNFAVALDWSLAELRSAPLGIRRRDRRRSRASGT